MITNLSTSILYICPECSTVSMRAVSIFEIKKKGGLSLFCSRMDCRYSDVVITDANDKYKITAECPICGENHTFTLSKKTLWNKNFLILNCPQSGFGILFIGKDRQRLMNEYSAQSEVIAGIIASNDDAYDELDTLFDIIELINSFANDKLIHCECGSQSIAVNINADSVSLVCKKCKKSITFGANREVLDFLSEADEIIIK